MKILLAPIMISLCIILSAGISEAQVTSAGSGNWSSGSTWVGGVVPDSTQNVLIASQHLVNIDNGNAVCNNITFGDTSSHLSMGSASSVLSVYGNFTLFSTAHKVFPFSAYWPAGAKIKFVGGAATQTLSG